MSTHTFGASFELESGPIPGKKMQGKLKCKMLHECSYTIVLELHLRPKYGHILLRCIIVIPICYLSGIMLHLGVIICAKLKVKVSVYFVTNIFCFNLNIVSTKPKHKNENWRLILMHFTFRK